MALDLPSEANLFAWSLASNVPGEHAMHAGGEFDRPEQMLEEYYLRRWLRARCWKVDVAAKCILAHAEWRVKTMPSGRIQTVDGGGGEVSSDGLAGEERKAGSKRREGSSGAGGRRVLLRGEEDNRISDDSHEFSHSMCAE